MDTNTPGPDTCARSWSVVADIDWGSIDAAAARSDSEVLMLVRRAALRAARRTVGLSHLLVALVSNSVASAVIARELHDSWKHFHALRSYLDVAEYAPAIAEAELDQHRRASEETPLAAQDIAAALARLQDEAARDCALFALIDSRSRDRALSRLAGRIAADRQQHSLGLARILTLESGASAQKTA